MQKKIIALAVAGLVSGAAFAQSNVTIYGVADVAYLYNKGDAGFTTNAAGVRTGVDGSRNFSGLVNGGWSGSRIGFKGTEELGNGLKAVFLLEYGYNINEAVGLGNPFQGGTTTRQSYVGLETAFGTFTAGRQYAPSYLYLGRNSSNEVTGNYPSDQLQSSGGPIATAGGTITTNSNSRWNNAIAFQSKDYSGLSTRVMYAFGQTGQTTSTSAIGAVAGGGTAYGSGLTYDGATGATTQNFTAGNSLTASTSDNGKFAISLDYMNGPLNVDLIYQSQLNVQTAYNNAAALTQGSDINEWYIGAGFDFKVVKIMGSYQQLQNKNNAASLNNFDAKVWTVGAIVPVGAAGKVRLEYGSGSMDQNYTTGIPVANQRNGTSSGYALGYTHDLSKRTMLYTSVARMKNDDDALDIGNNATGQSTGVGVRGESNWSVLAGVRHLF